jgi:hypothetical protein
MDLELLGFVSGILGAIWMKAAIGLMNEQRLPSELEKSLAREPENRAVKAFLCGLVLVLIGLGLETYARLLH